MFSLIVLASVVINIVIAASSNDVPQDGGNGRQKRLLFYDEEGNLVKTFTNPFLRQFALKPEPAPAYTYLSPYFLQPPTTTGLVKPYMVPVANEITQQIASDPAYQNKLLFLPAREPTIELNALCVGKRAQIPSPISCNTFLNCWDGWSYEQLCPPGLLFSKDGFCDFAHNVDCFDRKTDKEAETTEPRCEKEFQAFRNELSCNEFFVCVGKIPVRFKCPADLAYNQELGICDYSTRVSCNVSFEVATSAPPAEATKPDIGSAEASLPSQPDPQGPMKYTMTKNSVVNTQSITTTHMAMSRQDAIRQLELQRIAKVKTF